MPSTLAPTHYERSKGICPGSTDNFFRDMLDRAEVDTGDVESPVGYVTLVHVNIDDLIQYLPSDISLQGLVDFGIETGWYVTRSNSDGLIWAMTYGKGTYGEEQARADFAEADSTFLEWYEEMNADAGCDEFTENGSCHHSDCPNP